MRPNSLIRLLAACLLAVAGCALAQQDSSKQPLHLSADTGELDNVRGVSTYTGNVVVTRGQMRITGDVLRVYRGDGDTLDRIEVEGEPATFHDESPQRETPVDAEAPTMTYYSGPPERIELSGGATLTRGRDEFRGETVNYDIAADQVKADSSKDQRVQVTLFPKKDDSGNDSGDGQ